jgi:UDP-3-O-[3-hydroxymyristoyl] glucosamine N-acyltransferase
MKKSLHEIASLVSGEPGGEAKLSIKNITSLDEAKEGDLTFASDEKSVELFEQSKATAALVPNNLKKFPSKPHIKVPNFRLAMAKILGIFESRKKIPAGTHKTAIVSKTAKVSSGCTIMAYVVIGENTSIGNNAIIYPGCYIGDSCRIGSNTTIYSNVTLYDRTVIGNKCLIHAGVVLGVDGYGYAPVDGKYVKIPQLGNVIIEDDVELCANVSISRATMGSTIIKRGTKIDNLTHIAHNCKIGEDCAITGLVAIAGSTELKKHVSVGGTSGINDHITIGENTVVMGRSGVTKDIPANSVISGFPAQDHKKELDQQAAIRRLPKLIEKVQEIEKHLKEK